MTLVVVHRRQGGQQCRQAHETIGHFAQDIEPRRGNDIGRKGTDASRRTLCCTATSVSTNSAAAGARTTAPALAVSEESAWSDTRSGDRHRGTSLRVDVSRRGPTERRESLISGEPERVFPSPTAASYEIPVPQPGRSITKQRSNNARTTQTRTTSDTVVPNGRPVNTGCDVRRRRRRTTPMSFPKLNSAKWLPPYGIRRCQARLGRERARPDYAPVPSLLNFS